MATMPGVLTLRVVMIVTFVVVSTAAPGRCHSSTSPAETEDISKESHIFSTHNLPSEERYMPSIGNGHIATNVFSDTVYMNGLYNGHKGESHRARIPGWINIRLDLTLPHHRYSPVYNLDTREGAFKLSIDRDRAVVTQRIYAHRFYTRAIVNQIQVNWKPYKEPNHIKHKLSLAVNVMPGPDSEDITFEPPVPEIHNGRTIWSSCGKTMESEDEEYQKHLVDVCAYWTSVPNHIVIPRHGSGIVTFAMTVDRNKTVAKEELLQVLQENGEELYEKHVEHWQKLYRQAGIDIEGNLELSKVVNGIWYYYLSSLPSEESHHPAEPFHGLSPGGLARGSNLGDYKGHSFWDTEFWMFPPILLLYPKYGRTILQYRLDRVYAASQLAEHSGHKGYRFPWESAYTGTEVTPECCPEVVEFQHHITGCISYAARQYLATTRDELWLEHGGCSLITNIADFWASRATINYSTGLYDIENVMGPDEDHSNVTNSAFTNVIAGYSLYLAQYVACLCQSDQDMTKDPDLWADIASSLSLPYDGTLDYHPQFEEYERGVEIKQADVVLLGFPLQYPMNASTRANDLSYYESVTRSNGPAMTWSMHAIGHLQLLENDKAAAMFNKSYQPYLREPFKIWSEMQSPDVGAVNFLTGMGGFLQTLTFGYAGISIHLDKLEITRPQLPPGTTKLKIRGIKYLGADLSLDIEETDTTLTVVSLGDAWNLKLYNGGYDTDLAPGMTITLTGEGPFTITAEPWKECKLPADIIEQNYLRRNDLA